jgi:hypothetical protein
LGVWAANRAESDREAIQRWKRSAPFDLAELAEFAVAVVGLIQAWSPILPRGTVLDDPPQGASAPGPYAAEALGLPFAEVLTRTEPKRWHGPHEALRQAPFACALPDPPPSATLVIDDLIPSGTTMRLSIEAIRTGGVAAFGFAFSGC